MQTLTPNAAGRRIPRLIEWLAFCLVVTSMALAVSIVLSGVVLLLAGSAEAAQPSDEPAMAGSLKVKRSDDLAYARAIPLLSTEVRIRVSGPIARTRVTQVFRNPDKEWLEGVYLFPLPESAAVDHLSLQIGERLIEGEIRERGQAKTDYEHARNTGKRASLVEQERPNMFTSTVANIGPAESVTVEIQYQQTLHADQGRYSLRFPMVVGPRYVPADGSGTPRVADADRITAPVARPQAESTVSNPVRIEVELDAGAPLAKLSSPYHAVKIDESLTGLYRVTLASDSVPANRDFELVWQPQSSALTRNTIFTEANGDHAYSLLMLLPPAQVAADERMPREVVFVIDTSGSMHGASIAQAKEALQLAVGRLQPHDRFNIIEFNSYARALFADARLADSSAVSSARRFISALNARGGTEMAKALDLALDGRGDHRQVRQVIFLTDGSVGNEDELFRLICARLGDSRLFPVGIGSAPNSHFMTEAARSGRGSFTYIGRPEEVREKMSELFAKLEAPVLKDIEIEWPEGAQAEAWPRRVPDLYLGEPIVVTAKTAEARGLVRLHGKRGDALWHAEIDLAAARPGEGIGRLWGTEKITSLMQAMRQGDQESQIRPQVISVALEHHLVSKYTSLVAIDKTPARPLDKNVQRADLPLNLPDGWSYEHVFGELPQGATDWRWNLVLGLLATVLAGAFALVLRRYGGGNAVNS